MIQVELGDFRVELSHVCFELDSILFELSYVCFELDSILFELSHVCFELGPVRVKLDSIRVAFEFHNEVRIWRARSVKYFV